MPKPVERSVTDGLTNGLKKRLRTSTMPGGGGKLERSLLKQQLAEKWEKRPWGPIAKFARLRRSYMDHKKFGDLEPGEIARIKAVLKAGEPELNEYEESLLRRLNIAELANTAETEKELAERIPEIEKEFEAGRHLFEKHDPDYVSRYEPHIRRLKTTFRLKKLL